FLLRFHTSLLPYSFPTRRSSDLISIDMAAATLVTGLVELSEVTDYAIIIDTKITGKDYGKGVKGHFLLIPDPTSIPKLFNTLGIDRKSTRLNSSHVSTSYAVFCL